MPRAWVRAWNERVGRPAFSVRSVGTTYYASLSPIHFIGIESLIARLGGYEQKKKKKFGVRDNSKANQQYFISPTSGRDTFENSR